jgi:hypothetical protein
MYRLFIGIERATGQNGGKTFFKAVVHLTLTPSLRLPLASI